MKLRVLQQNVNLQDLEYISMAGLKFCYKIILFYSMHVTISGSPTGLEYIELQSRSVTLRWEQLNTAERCSPPILYSVRVTVVAGQQQQRLCNAQQLMESNTTNTHAIITGLCPYSRYSISIKACTEHGDVCGSYSSSLSVRTLEDGM